MKLLTALLFFTLMVTVSVAQINIIPRPLKVNEGRGTFPLTNQTAIISNNETGAAANFLAGILEKGFGKKPALKKSGKGIQLRLNSNLSGDLGNEGYTLEVSRKNIVIESSTAAGLFYGIQSLRQLLPVDFEAGALKGKKIDVAVVDIEDKPRFPWRAFMLDESRHFKGMEVVKDLLDQMALIKMNTFHWHLTDDQGWRIEIKKYPKLTEVGGYRKNTQTSRRSEGRTGVPHGGFYTQDQIREIVQYASERQIKVVPEIEMPGHATAAIAAYPWLGTLGTTTEVSETFGMLPDSYNIGNARVTQFLMDVLAEVFELFPAKIVHIGGDEVKFEAWKNSAEIQKMMKDEGLKTPADAQIFFTNKISNYIDKNGFRMMGWNEILGGNIHEWQKSEDIQVSQKLAPSAIVHFWKGSLELVEKAVSEGYDVVNSVHSMTYLDYTYKSIPLSKAYSFNPVPEGLDAKYHHKILGTGCQMWSEWIPAIDQMNMQVFPRIAAYAEVGWTSNDNKNYNAFVIALSELKQRWKREGIQYYDGVE